MNELFKVGFENLVEFNDFDNCIDLLRLDNNDLINVNVDGF
jgi:hypothetical protein